MDATSPQVLTSVYFQIPVPDHKASITFDKSFTLLTLIRALLTFSTDLAQLQEVRLTMSDHTMRAEEKSMRNANDIKCNVPNKMPHGPDSKIVLPDMQKQLVRGPIQMGIAVDLEQHPAPQHAWDPYLTDLAHLLGDTQLAAVGRNIHLLSPPKNKRVAQDPNETSPII